MNTPAPRYAIYFVPGDTTLYQFGTSVLGYDCYTGRDDAFIDGVDESWVERVREPRVYGFHATLKAPFRLAKGFNQSDLDRAVLDFASDHPAISVGDLVVRELGSFIALVPKAPRPLLDRFAGACVREFDRFRAPLSEPERQRRLVANLSARQIENLEQWGYPYVFDDFCFHMTLTGSLASSDRSRALQFLSAKFEQLPGAQLLVIDRIVVARQTDKTAPFQVIQQALLGHSAYRPYAYSL
jgi:hypothetical protein